MGIDAVLYVKTVERLEDYEVNELAYDIAEAFGADNFWIWRKDKGSYSNQKAITRHYEDTDGGQEEIPNQLEVHVATRYYGEDYERGNLPLILLICEWLEYRIPGCQLFYGGSGDYDPKRFTKATRLKLFKHFARVGHKPYRTGFGHAPSRHCGFCDRSMIQYGTGNAYAAFHCPGCGVKEATRDGGLTWGEAEH